MPRKAAGLSAIGIKTLKPGRHGDGSGLYIFVRPNGAKFWLFRYMIKGRTREMGLGGYPAVKLAEARDRARALSEKVRAGIDPLDEREAVAAAEKAAAEKAEQAAATRAKTFQDVADAYIAAHEGSWRNAKHRQQWRNTLATYAYPILGAMPVEDVNTAVVMRVLEPIWRSRPETASRLRGRIERILDYARTLGWRTGENPARWRGHIANALPNRAKVRPVEHHPALPWREIAAFMAALKEQDGIAAMAMRFLILTATRTNEVLGATWAEIDLTEAVWTIPAARMKMAKEHRVPLSDAALAVLQEAMGLRLDADPDALVFPGQKPGKPLSNMALLALLRRMGRLDLTAHGFRSTFRDWCAEATNHPYEVAETALAHTTKNKVEAAYRRGDLLEKRRVLMSDWAAFCTKPAPAGEVVVAMRRPIAS